MFYRIVILNGDKRGEQFEVGRDSLRIGRGNACAIQLPDPDLGDIHAEVTRLEDSLLIKAVAETNLLTVNKSAIKESFLKHGDVVEIGKTRLFVQSFHNAGMHESLAGFRRWRLGLTIGLPVALLTGLILILNRCRPETPQRPCPAPPPARFLFSGDTNNSDWAVTNIPQIQILASITLTSTPSEVIEALEAFRLVRTNTSELEIADGLREIERAAHFLEDVREQDMTRQSDGVSERATNDAPATPSTGLKE